eukprot:CAMPEP_0179243348 /NCGR_PEP_ID=MMETSP0797-20121207/17492_1 /TAXON_ID=47934 /ORGANISM="Dinophysis acuminata, Strain DAEP01" /LENGTH=82 /DNA_ID=CAMNT_0020950823 /DNA_START=78 /DNA_END=323 /DNA_ORIENTATION=+
MTAAPIPLHTNRERGTATSSWRERLLQMYLMPLTAPPRRGRRSPKGAAAPSYKPEHGAPSTAAGAPPPQPGSGQSMRPARHA